MEKQESWELCAPKDDDPGFWVNFGAFWVLVGVSTILGDTYWWASWDLLWPLFMMGVGVQIAARALRDWFQRR